MIRLTAPLLIATLALAACGGSDSDSGWSPSGWFKSSGPTTLEPEGGYPTSNTDPRPGMPSVTGAQWKTLNEGRLLLVTGMAPTKGYWDVGLIPERPSPTGRLSPDPDGTLRLRFVAWPPPPDSQAARMAANPQSDQITSAVSIPSNTLAGIKQVVISSASNTISIRK